MDIKDKEMKSFLTMVFLIGMMFVIVGIMENPTHDILGLEGQNKDSLLKAQLDSGTVNRTPNNMAQTYMMKEQIHRDVCTTMFYMAQTLISYEESWGQYGLNDEEVGYLRHQIKENNFKDKVTLMNILDRWQHQDFTHITSDYNYLWGQVKR